MKLLDYRDLKPAKGISFTQRHIEREVAAGRFPQPVKVGQRRVAWVDDEIDTWIAERAALRQPVAA